MRIFNIAIAALFLLIPAAVHAKSVAFVIGNDDYEHLPPLAVAVSDAKAHCTHLREVRKFDQVNCLYNVNKTEIERGLLQFLRDLDPGDTAMVVYSGHGVQLDANDPRTVFLIPTDLAREDLEPGLEEFSLDQNAIRFDKIRAAVRSRNVRLSVFVLDNCRDNPLAGITTRTLGLANGLGSLPADKGEFIFFSASEGETAFDRIEDNDANSPFTTAFIKAFQPNVPLTTVANTVEQAVLVATRQAGLPPQRPRYDDNVEGPGCIEGVGECSGKALFAKLDVKIDEALSTLEYAKLTSLVKSMENHPRRAEVEAQIEIHHLIDRQHTLLESDQLKKLYAQLVRHPRREEVRGLIRRAILFDACSDLQRYGWSCPNTPNPEVPKAPEAKKEEKPRENTTVAALSPAQENTAAKRATQVPSAYVRLAANVDKSTIDKFTLPLKNVQEALYALGHYDGRADGQFGPRTAAAQDAWRKSVGSPSTDRQLTKTEQIILLTMAAEESPASRALLGLFVAQGVGYPKNVEEGRILLNDAISDGFSDARAWLAQLENL